jgi:hypothetical protein
MGRQRKIAHVPLQNWSDFGRFCLSEIRFVSAKSGRMAPDARRLFPDNLDRHNLS